MRTGSAFSGASGSQRIPTTFWANFTLALAAARRAKKSIREVIPTLALAYYEKAQKIRPQAAAVLNDVGLVQIDKYWIWDAATTLHGLVKNNPRFAPGLNNLGKALERKGYWPLAVLTYQDALEIDPELAAAHCNLGEIQAGSGSLDEAIDHYRQALRSDPDCARAHHLLRCPSPWSPPRGGLKRRTTITRRASNPSTSSVVRKQHERGDGLLQAGRHDLTGDATWTPAPNKLHIPMQDKARLKEAIDHFRQAVRVEQAYFQDLRFAAGGS